MKKWMILVVIGFLATSVGGCGDSKTAPPAEEANTIDNTGVDTTLSTGN
ncbi:MAG: hypothetical protein H6822_22850 [Planctomycetaceae bacterium]|nr:hypothetical protein [Planctomycetales bacterium]MCB9925035.1 hypothetical protein [Planctomycetaceae bacterium]